MQGSVDRFGNLPAVQVLSSRATDCTLFLGYTIRRVVVTEQ